MVAIGRASTAKPTPIVLDEPRTIMNALKYIVVVDWKMMEPMLKYLNETYGIKMNPWGTSSGSRTRRRDACNSRSLDTSPSNRPARE